MEKPKCYYNDHLCSGKVVPVMSFKQFLCQKCLENENSVPDDFPLDYDHSIND